jgi:LacI family transcriptional regulator
VVLESDAEGYAPTIILDKQDQGDYYTLYRSRMVDGLLFAVTRADFRPFQGLRDAGVPFVLINNYQEGLNSVDALPESGMRKAFSHAYNLGHRRMGYITGDMRYRNAIDRLAVFQKLSAEYGLRPLIEEGDFSRGSGYRVTYKLVSVARPPTLIMTASDRAAVGVLGYTAENKIRVPGELSVIGYDDLPPAEDISPSLSTVVHPVTTLARRATRLLINILEKRAEEPVQEWLDTDFVIRESTAVCPSEGRL